MDIKKLLIIPAISSDILQAVVLHPEAFAEAQVMLRKITEHWTEHNVFNNCLL